jgi:hypothetical protein
MTPRCYLGYLLDEGGHDEVKVVVLWYVWVSRDDEVRVVVLSYVWVQRDVF